MLVQLTEEEYLQYQGKSSRLLQEELTDSDYTVTNFGSGGTLPNMYFAIMDIYGNVMTTDSWSEVTITISSSSGTFANTIEGKTSLEAINGTFNMSDIVFTGDPNSIQSNLCIINLLEIQISTNAINMDLPSNSDMASVNLQSIEIEIQLRNCIFGESLSESGKCVECEKGAQYLLMAVNEITRCKECQSSVSFCMGGARIFPKPGYWRSSNISDNFIECYNSKACL